MYKLLQPSSWINFALQHTTATWVTRISLAIIYLWFGVLKLFDLSPANPLVAELQVKTLPFISFELFIILFGLFEMAIGIAWLVPRLTRLISAATAVHLFTTSVTLFLVPQAMWSGLLVPTLEGQYVIKNLLIISAILVLWDSTKVKIPSQRIL